MKDSSNNNQEIAQYLVSHYMQKDPATISDSANLKEAVEGMIDNKTNGLVVIDKNRKVVGILSGWDIIQYIVPDYLEEDLHLAAFEAGDLFKERIETLADHHIANFMTDKVHTIKANDPLMKAATLLSEFHIRQLPVVDEQGTLTGYINRTDIKKAIGDILGFHEKFSTITKNK